MSILLHERLDRALAALVGLACIAVGGSLAWHYPIAPAFAIAGFVLWTAISYRWPFAWLLAVPALLPVTGFATWTGWFTFEELDLLVLGAAASGYARRAWDPMPRVNPPTKTSWRPSSLMVALVALFAISYAVSLCRGLIDADGLQFDWIGSYDSSMNSVRLCKSFAMALLLWPLLQSALANDERRAVDFLAGGLAAGLGAASLVALWERAAFTDLLNFSSDYRTTALFWEMHVGGAALDGFLALTVPFAVWELGRKSGPLWITLALVVAGLAAYACLTTFSRGVYLAVPISLAVLGVLAMSQRPMALNATSPAAAGKAIMLTTIASAAFYLVFREGGYRALLAFIATLAAALHVGSANRILGPWRLGLALGAGLTLGTLDALLAPLVPKGPYVVFAVAFACNIAFLRREPDSTDPGRAALRWALLTWLAAAAAVVALHWGGSDAFRDSVLALSCLLALTLHNGIAMTPWVPATLRLRSVWVGIAALIAGGVVVFAGGAYMGDRFATSSSDFEIRTRHWSDGIGILRGSTDWWLGKGLGRFPVSYFFSVPNGIFPGSFSLRSTETGRYLALAGPRYPTSWGDLFRVAQRVSAEPGTYTVLLDVRTAKDIVLHLEVCEQHLLYNGECAAASVMARGSPDWQRVPTIMDGRALAGGPWYAPRLAFFAMAVDSSGQSIDIRDVSLIGPQGRSLLVNGYFADGMARWIPISERFHLPWHIKNLALNVLFDQGILGLTIFVVLLAAALWRLAYGHARYHPLAPCLAAGIIGFIVVGAFDSLLDVPRLAFLFYLLLLASLGLSAPERAALPQID